MEKETATPETDAAWENDHPLHRLSDQEKRELCGKFEAQVNHWKRIAMEEQRRAAELSGKLITRPTPRTITEKTLDRLGVQWGTSEWIRVCSSLEAENDRLRLALGRAARWGIRSDGFSGEVSDSLRVWIDGGMVGDPPEVPSYYP